MQGDFINGYISNTGAIDNLNKDCKIRQSQTSQGGSIFDKGKSPGFEQLVQKSSSMFKEFNKDLQIKRDERIRKEMEDRNNQPEIEDEIIEAFQSAGKGIVKGIKAFFGNKQEQETV